MTLARLFQERAAPAVWAAFAAHPALEEALDRLHRDGQAAWPQLPLTPAEFVAFLARQLPPESAEPQALATLRARELYLVCACARGLRAAQTILESEYQPKIRQVLQRLGTPEALIADISQDLWGRLIETQDPAVARRGYAGRGDLGGWLCTAAVREAGLRHKRERRELPLEQACAEILPDHRRDPEAMLLSGRLKELFHAAFAEAVAALTSRERNLLRYHFLAALSIDQIGTIYKIHRATAARWVTRAQERLISLTRERFILRAQVSADSLPGLMQELHSQLSLNLGNILKDAAERDPALRAKSP